MRINTDLRLLFKARPLLPVLLVVLLLFILITTTAAQAFKLGDVNGDGKIDVRDVVLVQKYVLRKITLTEQQKNAALVKGYGEINAQDVALIMQYSIGRIKTFPLNIAKVDDFNTNVALGTARGSIGLPLTVSATLSDGTRRNISVSWDAASTPAYNANASGTYVFMGNLVSLPTGITNPGAIRAKANVTVSSTPGPVPPPSVGAIGNVSAANFVYTATNTIWSFQITEAPLAIGQTVTINLQNAKVGNIAYSTNDSHYSASGFTVNAANATTAGNERVVLTATSLIPVNTTVVVNVSGMTPAGSGVINQTGSVRFTRNDTGNGRTATFTVIGTTGVSLSPTTISPQGVEYVPGKFTSGKVTPAEAVYMDDTLKIAGITVYINWKDGTTNYAASHVYDSDITAKTATVAIYRGGTAGGTVYSNAATALAAAINKVKDDTNYTGVLKATVTAVSVNSTSATINVTAIQNTVPAIWANAWKFDVSSPSNSGFSVYYDGKNIANQISQGETNATLHVNEVKAVGSTVVSTGATTTGSIVVNVNDGIGVINEKVAVPVVQGQTAATVAGNIRTALGANTTITHATNGYFVSGAGDNIVLTQRGAGKPVTLSVTRQ